MTNDSDWEDVGVGGDEWEDVSPSSADQARLMQKRKEDGHPQMGVFPSPSNQVIEGGIDQAIEFATPGPFRNPYSKPVAKSISDQVSGWSEALSQGALDTILAGTPEAIATRSGANINTVDSPKFAHPNLYASGQVAGAALPLGRIASVAKQGMATAIKEGARLGAVFGGASAISNEAQKEDPLFTEAVKEGVSGSLKGAALGGATGGVLSKLSSKLNVPPPLPSVSVKERKMLTQAIKPANKLIDKEDVDKIKWDVDVELAAPEILRTGRKVNDQRDLMFAADEAMKKVYGEIESVIKASNPNTPPLVVNGERLFDKILEAADNVKAIQEDPGSIIKVAQLAQLYRRDIPIVEAEELLKKTNEELYSYYVKTAIGKAASRSDMETKAQLKLAEGLRNDIDDALEAALGPRGRRLKRTYGALRSLRNETSKRVLVADRQQPMSLAEQLSMAEGIGRGAMQLAQGNPLSAAASMSQPIMAKILKDYQTSDAIIRRAFQRMQRQQSPMDFSRLQPGASILVSMDDKDYVAEFMGVTGKSVKVRMKDGSVKSVDPEDIGPAPEEVSQ